MGQTWLEYKYSFLGNFNNLIESLSEIEKNGLLTRINTIPPMRAYEKEAWRINISAERIDIYPKRDPALNPSLDEFFNAYELLMSVTKGDIARIAINSTVLFSLDVPNSNDPIYTLGDVAIAEASPAEFTHRINLQQKIDDILVNNIVTISKGTFAKNNKAQMGVFIGFDINTASGKPNEYITRAVSDSITSKMVELFVEVKKKYAKSI